MKAAWPLDSGGHHDCKTRAQSPTRYAFRSRIDRPAEVMDGIDPDRPPGHRDWRRLWDRHRDRPGRWPGRGAEVTGWRSRNVEAGGAHGRDHYRGPPVTSRCSRGPGWTWPTRASLGRVSAAGLGRPADILINNAGIMAAPLDAHSRRLGDAVSPPTTLGHFALANPAARGPWAARGARGPGVVVRSSSLRATCGLPVVLRGPSTPGAVLRAVGRRTGSRRRLTCCSRSRRPGAGAGGRHHRQRALMPGRDSGPALQRYAGRRRDEELERLPAARRAGGGASWKTPEQGRRDVRASWPTSPLLGRRWRPLLSKDCKRGRT